MKRMDYLRRVRCRSFSGVQPRAGSIVRQAVEVRHSLQSVPVLRHH